MNFLKILKEFETVGGLNKSEFKEVLSLATKDSQFIFDGFPLRPYITYCLFSLPWKKNWLERSPLEYRPFTIGGTLMIYLFYLIHQNI